MRLCGELKITACEMANGVEYCYCEGSRCNLDERRRAGVRPVGSTVDDEDSEEDGSGSGALPPGGSVEAPETPEHHPASGAALIKSAALLMALVHYF